jgi:hypothetical protein
MATVSGETKRSIEGPCWGKFTTSDAGIKYAPACNIA